MNISYMLILIVSVLIASISQILLKKSAEITYPSLLKEYLNFYVVFGYGMMVISTVLTIIAFKGLDYKNGPIIESIGYLFVMLLSWKFLNEKITKKKIIGNALILIGIVIFYI